MPGPKTLIQVILLFSCWLATDLLAAETALFKGVTYNREDIDSCREEAVMEGFREGEDLDDYIETCLEDFQGMADYENKTDFNKAKPAPPKP